MTRDEVADIMAALLATLRHPGAIPDHEALLDGWHLALEDIPYDAARRAAVLLLKESEYFPEPVAIRDLVLQEATGIPDAGEAWAIIQSRLTSGPDQQFCLTYLAHTALKEAIDALGGAHNLKQSSNPGRDRADFYRIWPDIRKRHMRTPLRHGQTPDLPPGVLALECMGEIRLYRVPGDDEAAGMLGQEDVYERVTPRAIPATIQAAPPTPRELIKHGPLPGQE